MDTVVLQYTSLPIETPTGGVEMHIKQVSQALAEKGVEISIGIQACFTRLERIRVGDKVIVHTHGDCAVPLSFLKKLRSKTPSVCFMPVFHGTTAGRMRACGEYASVSGIRAVLREFCIARIADAAVCVSQHARLEAEKYYLLRAKTTVISNGANPDTFRPLDKISEERRILFIGRGSDSVKNLEGILAATKSAREVDSTITLALVPGHSEKNYPFIENLGPCDSKQLASIFKKTKALILASFYEGDPIVVREAQAAGLPILASAIPALRSSLEDYPNALFFDPRSTSDIREKIIKVLNGNYSPSPRLVSWHQAANTLFEFYKECLI